MGDKDRIEQLEAEIHSLRLKLELARRKDEVFLSMLDDIHEAYEAAFQDLE